MPKSMPLDYVLTFADGDEVRLPSPWNDDSTRDPIAAAQRRIDRWQRGKGLPSPKKLFERGFAECVRDGNGNVRIEPRKY